MDISSRWYKAAGASLVAAAVTARYVARWKRARALRRRAEQARLSGTGRYFIGLDLTDPYAKRPRPCDVAVLDSELQCSFSQWEYREDGGSIVPTVALGRAFLLAIDGPQGLAGQTDARMRDSERVLNAPGRTPYTLPYSGVPYAGFITGSVRLFHHLVTSGRRFRLLGVQDVSLGEANLVEVYPGAGWKTVAGKGRLPRKQTAKGREVRYALLQAQGVRFPDSKLPTTDQLDAAMAAWTGYCFNQGNARLEGLPPWLDDRDGVIREGYIVQPELPNEDAPTEEPEPYAPTG